MVKKAVEIAVALEGLQLGQVLVPDQLERGPKSDGVRTYYVLQGAAAASVV